MIDLTILAATTITNLIMVVLIISRNSKDAINRTLAGFITSLSVWTLFNYLSDQASSNNLIYTRLTFASITISAALIILLSSYFPTATQVLPKKIRVLVTIIAASIAILSFTPFLVPSVRKVTNGIELTIGPLYYAYLAFIILTIGTTVRNFIKQNKIANVLQRAQIKYLVSGFLAYALSATLLQLVFPIFFDSWSTSRYGPLFTTIFIAFITVAIIRHRLLDIRSIVARSLGYVLSLTLLVIVYVLFAFNILNSLLFQGSTLTTAQQVVFTILSAVLAFTFQPLRNRFDKATIRLFFRDAYDTQRVLDKLGAILVANIDSHKIQKGALAALAEAIKPTYAVFVFNTRVGALQKGDIVGQQWEIYNPATLLSILKKVKKSALISDDIIVDKSLQEVLRTEEISLIAPLTTKTESIGYLILGSKKSGNPYTAQDIGLLNIATNELAVALQNAQRFEEIQAFNITLQEKITEATRELKSTNKKLVALDEAKDEFISMASHQLRTPLTSIKGYISMMIEGDLGKLSSPQQQALKEAFTSSQRMVFLISDFLNVSRIKTGKFVIELKELFMPTMIQEELTQLKEMFEAKELTYSYDAPEEFPMVKLDDNKTRQVMMNMIDNAIYYTPAGGTITIQLYSAGEEVIFKVIDTGIGVPKSEQHKLFTKFFRAGNAKKARPDGTGLGLYMAQKVVLEQGGSIIFESVEGKGSTFGFRFPLAKIRADK